MNAQDYVDHLATLKLTKMSALCGRRDLDAIERERIAAELKAWRAEHEVVSVQINYEELTKQAIGYWLNEGYFGAAADFIIMLELMRDFHVI